jgi:excisionase family DNA binding protein
MKRPSADALKVAAFQLETHATALRNVAAWLRYEAARAAPAPVEPRTAKVERIAKDLPELLTIEEVAAVTQTAIGTIRHWIREGKLRSTRPGRRRFVYRESLEALLRDEG